MTAHHEPLFTFPFSVKGHHVGPEGWAHPWYVQNVAQDVSVAVSEAHGFNSAWYRAARGGWVMRSFEVDYRQPWILEQDLLARTWISKRTRLTALRQYQFVDQASEEVVGGAQAEWVYVDTNTGRPAPIPTEFDLHYALDPRTAVASVDLPQGKPVRVGSVPLRVHYSDLDVNGHANNVAYIRWVSDALREVGVNSRLLWWRIQFKLPAGQGENLRIEITSVGVNSTGAAWKAAVSSENHTGKLATAQILTAP